MPGMASGSSRGPGDVLSTRELNRATLHRQLLLERSKMSALAAVEQLVGLQAQVPNVPYLALWSRLRDFRPDDLADHLRDRTVVRAALMRSTIHLVTAADAIGLQPLMRPVMVRTFSGTSWSRQVRSDVDAIVAQGRALLKERRLSRAQLGAQLRERWPDHDPAALSAAVTYLLPLVQVTPRGVWGESGQAVWSLTEDWLNESPGTEMTPEDMVLRYLAAFGPASVMDIQAWCGLTRLREVSDRLGSKLRRFSTDEGGELVDLPDAPRPDPDTPAPVRFLPEYDNALLSYADRRRVISGTEYVPLLGGPGGYVGTLMVDGFVCAMWAVRRDKARARMEIRPSLPFPADDRDEVVAEGARLLEFVAPDLDHDVAVTGGGGSGRG
jgi:hypothetical protein